MKKIVIGILMLSFIFSSCIQDEIENNNETIFDTIWEDMDAHYGGFIARNINWDSLYTVYAPQVNNSLSEEELFTLTSQMLDVLDDQHVAMRTSENNDIQLGFSSGKNGDEVEAEKEFRLEGVLNNYLEADYFADNFGDEEDIEIQFVFGEILNENIGYIYLPHFEPSSNDWHTQIDDAIARLQNTDGIIIDVRNNGGGFPVVDRYVAKRFMAEEELIFTIETRNGPNHNDFDEPVEYFSTPEGDTYTKPIVALINKSTVSAGEEFMLYLQSQDHVTVLGSPTSNALSGVSFDRFLPNGWSYSYPVQYYKYPDGSTPEGVGIIPDIEFQNDVMDVEQGVDKLLELAIMSL